MNEFDENNQRVEIACAALQGVRERQIAGDLPKDIDQSLLAEALLMAVQMAAGPELTARVIRYSFVMVSAK